MQAVLVKLGETSIEVQDKKTNKVSCGSNLSSMTKCSNKWSSIKDKNILCFQTLAVHSYTVTSACGRGKVNQNMFAYISGLVMFDHMWTCNLCSQLDEFQSTDFKIFCVDL